MDKNFSIGQANEIVVDGRPFDLHNQYDFFEMSIGANRTLRMIFRPNPTYGEGLPVVLLDFRELGYLEVHARFANHSFTNLEEMGYMSPDQHDDQWLAGEGQATPNDHLYFRFESGHVRVHATFAHIKVVSGS